MKYGTLFLALLLAGCGGVELLTVTAIQGDLQAKNLNAVTGAAKNIAASSGKINLQKAIDTFSAEKGHYPASLDELAPGHIANVPNRPDGSPYGYDPATGRLLDGPAPPPATGPTPNDAQKINQIRAAINTYGRAVGFYPPSLAALVPAYLPALPKTDSGQDFIFYPENGGLFHPAQLAQPAQAQTQAATAAPPTGVGGGGGAGPMGEVMTGIAMQNQLNSQSGSATDTAGSYARGSVSKSAGQHNQQQEKAMDNLGL